MDIDIFVYSDESGVFDYLHNEFFVFGGIITLGKEEKDGLIRLYKKAESSIATKYKEGMELKASAITTSHKSSRRALLIMTITRILNQYFLL